MLREVVSNYVRKAARRSGIRLARVRRWLFPRQLATRVGRNIARLPYRAWRKVLAIPGIARHSSETVFAWVRQARRCPGCGSLSIEQPLALTLSKKERLRPRRRVVAAGCRGCGLLFVSPRPRHVDLIEHYRAGGERIAHRVLRENTERKRGGVVAELDAHINIRNPLPDGAVLDVGCGHGHWLNTFANCGWRTVGIEPATKAGFERRAEIDQIPLVPTFDVVLLIHVLEHLLDPKATIKLVSAAQRQLLLPVSDNYFCRRRINEGVPIAT